MSRGIDRTELTTRAPFDELFPIDTEVLDAVTESIRSRAFDWERPIMVWKNGSELVVVDGHTRLEAARKARLKEVPVILRKFDDERAALEFAIAEQRDRRNMSREQQAAHVMRVVETFDRPAQGERNDLPPAGGKLAAVELAAELAGVSVRQVERARRIKDSGDEQVLRAVSDGEITLAAAEQKLKATGDPAGRNMSSAVRTKGADEPIRVQCPTCGTVVRADKLHGGREEEREAFRRKLVDAINALDAAREELTAPGREVTA